ncbi:hypothetical protein OIU74_023772 [Salix koriyanagi]|uniref:Uncharacterized protein n=1 Tax=Salix koriyanagi TaxID=2511006 RepID=A0A9Q0WDJ1_9ROSI|nr:hypothetical protein OIU74_023772 [Salix koriyanagi]
MEYQARHPIRVVRLLASKTCYVLGKVRDFLGVISEANKRLQADAKENSEEYDIEVLTGNESEVVEMDLMLGIADLHTPEAVAAAEAAIAGSQSMISLAACSSETESEDSSDESESDDGASDDTESNGEDNADDNIKTCMSGKNDSTEDSAAEYIFERSWWNLALCFDPFDQGYQTCLPSIELASHKHGNGVKCKISESVAGDYDSWERHDMLNIVEIGTWIWFLVKGNEDGYL